MARKQRIQIVVTVALTGLLWLSLLAPIMMGSTPAAAVGQGDPGVPAKVESLLWDRFQGGGEADLIVRMAAQADLTAADQIADWEARGRYVYETLRTVAEQSQQGIKALLDGAGLSYETFIAGNELYVWQGTLSAVNALAALPEVASIRATRTYPLDPLIEQEPAASLDGTLAWGISFTKADQFWAVFGHQGNGIKVANIDTGVQWDHPALVNAFACPGQPGNAACWRDPSDICPGGTACDNHGHGTHTMGTMVADDDPALTYQAGMAPNARWIACKGCESSSCSDYALNTCADWILAPGGNAANRPHVVNNSWGGAGNNTWYLAKVQAWRAAGIFPAFSAGNTGSACGTLNSPGDYQQSFASGAVDTAGTIWSGSSRGPSDFGHEPYTKPNIAAPGVSVCSTVPGNGWSCGYTGTSMASPHSAGAVALLWSCNPGLIGRIDQTSELLQATAGTTPAGNCGAPPDAEGNYTYGYGYLDVHAAGLVGCASSGPNVLLLNADSDNDSGSPIQSLLQAYGDLGVVGLFDARYGTPTLAELRAYDVVLTWSNYQYADPAAIGNVLADYVDAGGKVINLLFSLGTHGWQMGGRFMSQGYTALNGTDVIYENACLGTFDPAHPIMDGITSVCDYHRLAGTYLTANSHAVARWTDNQLFVAAKDDRSVVSIAGYVGHYHQWTGQMPEVVHNAILWLARRSVYLPVVLRHYPYDPYFEPNNTFDQAYGPLSPATNYLAYPNDVEDYYCFRLTSARTVDIVVSDFVPTGGDLLLYNQAKELIRQFGSAAPVMRLDGNLLGAGKYYIRVRATAGQSSTQLYTLRVTYR